MSNHKAISERMLSQTNLTVEETDEYFVVKGVRVLNEVSRNGGTYSKRARESAARLLNRLPLAIEHTNEQGYRKYTDRVGQLREGQVLSDGNVVANAYVNKGHALAEAIKIDAKNFPENICLSIELPGDGWIGEDKRSDGGGYLVEDITRMDDVAIVAHGGTTSNLFEGHVPTSQNEEENDMSDKAAPGVSQTAINESIQKTLAEHEERRKVQEQMDKLMRERDDALAVSKKLEEQLNAYKLKEEQAARAAEIRKQAAELGAGEIAESYALSLAKLSADEAAAILKERAEMLKKAGTTTSTSPNFNAPSVGGTENHTVDAFGWLT
jgi:hypothetical protein